MAVTASGSELRPRARHKRSPATSTMTAQMERMLDGSESVHSYDAGVPPSHIDDSVSV